MTTNSALSVIDDTAVTSGYRTAATSKGKTDGRVSGQWATRPDDQKFLNLNDLYASVRNRTDLSTETNIDPRDITVGLDEAGQLLVQHEQFGRLEPNHWSFGQLSQLINAPAGYLRSLPAELCGVNLEYGLSRYSKEEMKAYTYKNGTSELRAITSTTYGRIFDHEVVEAVQKIAGNGNGDTRWKVPGVIDWATNKNGTVVYNPFVDITKESTTLYASDRDVYLFLVDDTHPIEIGKLPSGDPDLVFRGFVVWNSEVGSKAFGFTGFFLRGVCQNRNLWGVENNTFEVRIRHSAGAPQRFARDAAPLLNQYSNAGVSDIYAKVYAAKQAVVASNDEERVEFLTKTVGLNKSTAEKVIDTVLAEEQKPLTSVWDAVQGISAFARGIKHTDSRVAMELSAGKLMNKIRI